MSKVKIAPLVLLQEARADLDHLRNRNLLLAQAVEDLKEERDALLKRLEAVAPESVDPLADDGPVEGSIA